MPIEIRRITTDEWPALKTIRLAALADAPSAFGSTYAAEVSQPDEEWSQRAAASAEGPMRATMFALEGTAPVGLAGGYREEAGDDVVELVSMWTAATHRRRGVGRALVLAVVHWARETGADSVGLWVTRGNDAAARLYESLGFEPTGDHQPLPSDPCKDEVRMRLRISGVGA